MANYALMGDGKVIDGELYEELRQRVIITVK